MQGYSDVPVARLRAEAFVKRYSDERRKPWVIAAWILMAHARWNRIHWGGAPGGERCRHLPNLRPEVAR